MTTYSEWIGALVVWIAGNPCNFYMTDYLDLKEGDDAWKEIGHARKQQASSRLSTCNAFKFVMEGHRSH